MILAWEHLSTNIKWYPTRTRNNIFGIRTFCQFLLMTAGGAMSLFIYHLMLNKFILDLKVVCMCNRVMWTDCVLPSGYFLLEPWDLKKATRSPHLGVTLTVRDPNHEVLHKAKANKHILWYMNTWAGWLVCPFKPFKNLRHFCWPVADEKLS